MGKAVSHVYFPSSVLVSLSMSVDETRSVEIAMEGSEGVVGLAILQGGLNLYTQSTVRHAGTAMRLAASVLTSDAQQPNGLPDLTRRYLHALLIQIAQSGACARFHSFEARLARWLLMTHDRIGRTELNATHSSIATLLGVRRSTVTDAASGLHRRQLIDYHRGHIQIIDRHGLVEAACTCYAKINRQYDSFLD